MPDPIREELKEIRLDLIHSNPRQPRKIFNEEKLTKLALSMQGKEGLAQYPKVKPHPTIPGAYEIIAGERRIRAAKRLGWEAMLLVVRYDSVDSFLVSVAENCNREDLTPLEEAETFQRLRHEYHMTLDGISDLTGKSISHISSRFKLLEFYQRAPGEIQKMIREERFPSLSSVFNLAQYKGPRGKLIRFAYALMRGEEPPELTAAALEETEFGKKVRESKVPVTPEGILKRILKFGWSTESFFVVTQAFLALSPEMQKRGWAFLNKKARESISSRLTRLQKEIPRLVEALAKLQSVERDSPPKKADPYVPSEKEERAWNVAKQILVLLFYGPYNDGSYQVLHVNLSKQELTSALGSVDSPDRVEELAIRSLRLLRGSWFENPGALGAKGEFITFTRQIKWAFDVVTFEEFIAKIKRLNKATHPINLDALSTKSVPDHVAL